MGGPQASAVRCLRCTGGLRGAGGSFSAARARALAHFTPLPLLAGAQPAKACPFLAKPPLFLLAKARQQHPCWLAGQQGMALASTGLQGARPTGTSMPQVRGLGKGSSAAGSATLLLLLPSSSCQPGCPTLPCLPELRASLELGWQSIQPAKSHWIEHEGSSAPPLSAFCVCCSMSTSKWHRHDAAKGGASDSRKQIKQNMLSLLHI